MPRLLERINFPKVVSVIGVIFGVALGACGITGVVATRGGNDFLAPLALIEIAVMLLSAVGLVLTLIVWVIASALGKTEHRGAPQRLFDDTDKDVKS